MERVRITTFKNSEESFRNTLNEFEISNGRVIRLSEGIQASGIAIEIVLTGGWGLLAVACLAWANVRKSRRISITTKDKKVVWLEGYSAEEAAKILESARTIAVIDTEKSE